MERAADDLRGLFERFRERGDAAALGEAFDRTAPELRRVARHLARTRDDADDLVQQTYLTAIEKLATLERGREPLPWLIGILVVHGKATRRRNARGIEAERVDTREPERPDAKSERAELAALVERAVGELPERYRAVVEPYLAGEVSSHALGQATGRSPGAVRMQIHRGLALLRRALRRGAALGGLLAALVGLGSNRGLAALRESVIRGACAKSGAAAIPAGSSAAIGGLVMAKKLAAAMAAVLAIAIVGWFGRDALRPSDSSAARETEAAKIEAPASAAESAVSVASEPDAGLREPVADVVESAQTAPVPSEKAKGLSGRLLAPDLSPVGGVEVRLYVIDESWQSQSLTPQKPPRLEIERSRCVTEPDGGFVLTGARRGDFHMLAVDCGGPRGCMRVVDALPGPDGVAQLGDIVMPQTRKASGRIVDEQGHPIAGARVRAVVWREELDAIAEGVATAAPAGKGFMIAEVGPQILAAFAEFPAPTTTSGSDGRYELQAPTGEFRISADEPGHVAASLPTFPAADSAGVLPDLVLATGGTVRGRLVDSQGRGVADALVLAGTASTDPRKQAMLKPARSDADGRFTVAGLHPGDSRIVAARRSKREAWKVVQVAAGAEADLVLDPEAALEIAFTGPDGERLDGVVVDLTATAVPMFVTHAFNRLPSVDAKAEGVARFDSLSPGTYIAVARKPGFAPKLEKLDVTAPSTSATIAMQLPRLLEVEVKDAASGAPVADALVRVVGTSTHPNLVIQSQPAGADGIARFELAPPDPSRPFEKTIAVTADHPEYAPTRELDVAEGAGRIEVVLERGGELVARVLERGQPTSKRWTMRVGSSRVPLLASTEANGTIHVDRLTSGKTEYVLFEAWRGLDPVAEWFRNRESIEPAVVHRGTFEIRPGESTEIEIELAKDFQPPGEERSRVRGTVRVDGKAPKGLRLQMSGLQPAEHVSIDVDEGGEFDTGWIPAGKYYAEVAFWKAREDLIGTTPWKQILELKPGETREIEVDVRGARIEFHVRDARGADVEGARVMLSDSNGRYVSNVNVLTDARGHIARVVFLEGPIHVEAAHERAGLGQVSVEAIAGRTVTAEVELDAGVPCRGTIELPPAAVAIESECDFRLSFHPMKDKALRSASCRIAPSHGIAEFEVVGLRPGTYRVVWETTRGPRPIDPAPIELVLGPQGATDLVLRFSQ